MVFVCILQKFDALKRNVIKKNTKEYKIFSVTAEEVIVKETLCCFLFNIYIAITFTAGSGAGWNKSWQWHWLDYEKSSRT